MLASFVFVKNRKRELSKKTIGFANVKNPNNNRFSIPLVIEKVFCFCRGCFRIYPQTIRLNKNKIGKDCNQDSKKGTQPRETLRYNKI